MEEVIFNGEDLVACGSASHPGATAVVTFGTRDSPRREAYFARGLLRRSEVSYVCVTARRNHWWQTPEIEQLLPRIRSFLGSGRTDVRVYGASMGAFAALVFAERLSARSVLAIAPVFTVDAGRDARWRHDLVTLPALYDGYRPGGVETHLVYDRHGDDAPFVPDWHDYAHYHYPNCGHLILFWLAETGRLGDFVCNWIAGDTAAMRATFDRMFRERRRNPYFFTDDRLLTRFCRRHGIDDVQAARIVTHQYALSRCRTAQARELFSYRLLFFLSNRNIGQATALLRRLAEQPVTRNFTAPPRSILQYLRRGGDAGLARRAFGRIEDIGTAMPAVRDLYRDLEAELGAKA